MVWVKLLWSLKPASRRRIVDPVELSSRTRRCCRTISDPWIEILQGFHCRRVVEIVTVLEPQLLSCFLLLNNHCGHPRQHGRRKRDSQQLTRGRFSTAAGTPPTPVPQERWFPMSRRSRGATHNQRTPERRFLYWPRAVTGFVITGIFIIVTSKYSWNNDYRRRKFDTVDRSLICGNQNTYRQYHAKLASLYSPIFRNPTIAVVLASFILVLQACKGHAP